MGQKIYLDTNIYIAFFEDVSGVSGRIEEILITSLEKDVKIIASPLISMELLVAPLRNDSYQLINVYKNLQNHITNIDYVDFSKNISDVAAELRAKYDLATPDCIHIATAIQEKVDIFYTMDKGISRVKEINVETI